MFDWLLVGGVKVSNQAKLVIKVEEYGIARTLEDDSTEDNDKQRCVEIKVTTPTGYVMPHPLIIR